MGLREDREAAALDALHQPHLPQRPVAPQMMREHAPGEHLQLSLATGRRQSGVTHVIPQIKPLIIDPTRPRLAERNHRQPLPITRHQAQTRIDMRQQPLIPRRIAGKDQHTRHMHVRRRVLQIQKRRIKRTKPVLAHPIRHDTPTSPPAPQAPEEPLSRRRRRRPSPHGLASPVISSRASPTCRWLARGAGPF